MSISLSFKLIIIFHLNDPYFHYKGCGLVFEMRPQSHLSTAVLSLLAIPLQ